MNKEGSDKMLMLEYKTTKGNVIGLEHNEIPYRMFEYRINDKLVMVGTKRDIQKELGITNMVLNRRLNNTKVGRIKKKHELILIEG